MLKEMEEAAKEWGVGGRVAWIGLALSYLLLPRVSELFAEDDGRVRTVYCLRGEDVAFYTGERKVEGGERPGDRHGGVTFQRIKRLSRSKKAVLVRTRGDWGTGRETVELMQKLYRIHDGGSDLPLMAYRSHGG